MRVWTVRHCRGCETPRVMFADPATTGAICADCAREYAELCGGCEDEDCYPELDIPYGPNCQERIDHFQAVALDAYRRGVMV